MLVTLDAVALRAVWARDYWAQRPGPVFTQAIELVKTAPGDVRLRS